VLDDLMRAGWPALEEVGVDGWIARFSGGVTQRANSVLPLAAPADLDAALARVEQLYADRELPVVFQVGPGAQPADLDEKLSDRGYEFGSLTSIQTARIGDLAPPADVAIAEAPDQDWLDLWWAVDGRGDADALAIAVKILTGGPALYATIGDAHGAVAVGRLALVGAWGGVYCMAVRADARRRGLGGAVLRGLLAAARARGVTHTWLHVLDHNTAARRLYQRAGYAETARYHYRSLHRGQEAVQHVHPEP
jgi:N-acetylglutamate synthase